jgi:hypothetical protein
LPNDFSIFLEKLFFNEAGAKAEYAFWRISTKVALSIHNNVMDKRGA